MARRSKEELIAEFHRLYDIFETLNLCMEPIYGAECLAMMKENVIKRDRMLEWLSEGTATASEIVQGTQEGLNDTLLSLQYAMEDKPEKVETVLTAYKQKTGRHLYADTGNPLQIVKAIVRRGRIENDTEFYMLKEVMSCVDQVVFKEPQTTKAYEMLDHYEMNAGK